MKRIIALLFISSIFIVACQPSSSSITSHTIIDWVDFVKIDDVQYEAIYSGVIADPDNIGEEIGEVAFKMDQHITDASYKVKNNDASYLEIGTKIFSVKDEPSFVAVQDHEEINGYRLYQAQGETTHDQWTFTLIDQKEIKKLEIYQGYTAPDLHEAYTNAEEIMQIIEILEEAEEKPSFTPDISNGDPDIYHIVCYTNHLIAATEVLFFDGNVWYWYPHDVAMISDDIEEFIHD